MSIYYPKCEPLPDQPGWVASDQYRSSFSIIWTCLFIVSICTWAVLHPPVPAETAEDSLWEVMQRRIYLTVRTSWWWLVALIAPECVAGGYAGDFLAARHGRAMMKEVAEEDGVPWSLTHAFFADMGGFAITFKDAADTPAPTGSDPVFIEGVIPEKPVEGPEPLSSKDTIPAPMKEKRNEKAQLGSAPGDAAVMAVSIPPPSPGHGLLEGAQADQRTENLRREIQLLQEKKLSASSCRPATHARGQNTMEGPRQQQHSGARRLEGRDSRTHQRPHPAIVLR